MAPLDDDFSAENNEETEQFSGLLDARSPDPGAVRLVKEERIAAAYKQRPTSARHRLPLSIVVIILAILAGAFVVIWMAPASDPVRGWAMHIVDMFSGAVVGFLGRGFFR